METPTTLDAVRSALDDVHRVSDAHKAALLAVGVVRDDSWAPGPLELFPKTKVSYFFPGSSDPYVLKPGTDTSGPLYTRTTSGGRDITVELVRREDVPEELSPDFVRTDLATGYGPAAIAIPYRVKPADVAAYADAVWSGELDPVDAVRRLSGQAVPILRFKGDRPVAFHDRRKFAVPDFSLAGEGVWTPRPRADLEHLVANLDRLGALAGRLRLLADGSDSASRSARLSAEADQLHAFRSELESANLRKLAALWAETAPEIPVEPTTDPKRPAARPARLR